MQAPWGPVAEQSQPLPPPSHPSWGRDGPTEALPEASSFGQTTTRIYDPSLESWFNYLGGVLYAPPKLCRSPEPEESLFKAYYYRRPPGTVCWRPHFNIYHLDHLRAVSFNNILSIGYLYYSRLHKNNKTCLGISIIAGLISVTARGFRFY